MLISKLQEFPHQKPTNMKKILPRLAAAMGS
jgi:hypothetical protein